MEDIVATVIVMPDLSFRVRGENIHRDRAIIIDVLQNAIDWLKGFDEPSLVEGHGNG